MRSSYKIRVWEEYELGGELVQLVGSSFSCYESDGLVWLTSSQQEDDEGLASATSGSEEDFRLEDRMCKKHN
ncbi:unnamed protein product [Gadus morhua 'NCC']